MMTTLLIAALVLVVLLAAVVLLSKRRSGKSTTLISQDAAEADAATAVAEECVTEAVTQAVAQQGEPTAESAAAPKEMTAEGLQEPLFDLEDDLAEESLAEIEEELADEEEIVSVEKEVLVAEESEAIAAISEEPVAAETPAAEEVSLDSSFIEAELDAETGEVHAEAMIADAEEAVTVDIDSELLPDGSQEIMAPEKQVDRQAEEPRSAKADAVEPAALASGEITLTESAYGDWLSDLEQQRRQRLGSAVAGSQEGKRNHVQLELVLINERLALLADSYLLEKAIREEALKTLDQFMDRLDAADLRKARQGLRSGGSAKAELLFDSLVESDGPGDAVAAFMSGQLAESRADLRKAMARYEKAVILDQDNPRYLRAAGVMARRLYRYREALPWLEAYVQRLKEQGEEESADYALALRELAYTFVVSGQYKQAGPLYKRAMTILASVFGPDHPEMALSWYQIGELQETLGEYDKAVSLFKKTLAILEGAKGMDHPSLAPVLDKLAGLCMELELERESVPLYERLVAIREKALRPTHPQLAISYNSLAESYRLQGQYAQAEQCYLRSLAINEAINGKQHPSVAAILQELAKLCRNQKKFEEADRHQERAAAIFEQAMQGA